MMMQAGHSILMICHTKNNVVLSLYMHTSLPLLYRVHSLLAVLLALCQGTSQDDRWGGPSIQGGDLSGGQKVPRTVNPATPSPNHCSERLNHLSGISKLFFSN